MINDIINGLFEFFGAILCWINVYKIFQDKCVKGVYWPATAFFSAWGIWNLYYYSSLNQWWSLWGGVAMVTANCAWVMFAIRYKCK